MSDRMDGFGRLLALVNELANTTEGLSLDEIADELGQGRRTAERMRNIISLYFDLEELVDGRKKRFRIRDGLRPHLTKPDAAEIAALQSEVQSAAAAGSIRALPLDSLRKKIWANFDQRSKLRIDPDLELLASLQHTLVSPGPYAPAGRETLAAIMQAILSAHCLEFNYKAEQREKAEWRRVIVCGLLHGSISYLVGQQPGRKSQALLYRLDRMEDVTISGVVGEVPDGFELDSWVANSFGIWRDAEDDIILRALPHFADRARHWRFHPHQQLEDMDDDSIIIRFRASGLQELADHIFTWGGGLEIVAPAKLRVVLQQRIQNVQAMLDQLGGPAPNGNSVHLTPKR